MTPTDLARARRLLATPPGLPGSGRVRYGAAMTLHEAGEMSFAALEVYRVLSMTDGEDPVALLRARRLRRQPPAPEDPAADLADLAEALDQALASIALPGAAELRRVFALARSKRQPGPWRVPDPPDIVGRDLPAALSALAEERSDLATALRGAHPWLGWSPREGAGADAAFAPLLGPAAPWPCETAEIGLALAARGTMQSCLPSGSVAYVLLPLTGPHLWRMWPDRPARSKPALEPVALAGGRVCEVQVGEVPFLALAGRIRGQS